MDNQLYIMLTEQEGALIVDALNGAIFDDAILPESILWREIADAIRLDGLDAKWQVDGPALVAKLKSASHDDAERIVKLAQEFWGENYHITNTFARVRAIGLANAVNDDTLITATEAARLCGKSVAALGQLAAKGKLATFRDADEPNPQHATRYKKSEILAL